MSIARRAASMAVQRLVGVRATDISRAMGAQRLRCEASAAACRRRAVDRGNLPVQECADPYTGAVDGFDDP